MKTFQQFIVEASSKDYTSMNEFKEMVNKFLPFVQRELKLKEVPSFNFENSKFSKKHKTFGITGKDNQISVVVGNRHPLDVLRTLAHEIAHFHQRSIGKYGTGKDGSELENEASAIASVILRKFGRKYPEYFKLSPTVE